MELAKNDLTVSVSCLWQVDEGEESLLLFDLPSKNHLLFGLFVLDKYSDDTGRKLDRAEIILNNVIQEYTANYAWTEFSGVQLRRENFQGTNFIFGQVCVEDNAEQEEKLVVTILRRASKLLGPQVFIKVSDTECDFLLLACHEELPKSLQFPVANNRLWLHEGQFKFIPPDTENSNKGLEPEEALNFLINEYFKCTTVPAVKNKLDALFPMDKKPAEFYLNDFVQLSVDFTDRKVYEILSHNPTVINYVLKNIPSISDRIDTSSLQSEQKVNTYPLKLLIGRNHIPLLSLYLQIKNLKSDPSKALLATAFCIQTSLRDLLLQESLQLRNKTDGREVRTVSPNIMEQLVFEEADILKHVELERGVEPNEQLMDMFTNFFNEEPHNQKGSKKVDLEDDDASGDEDTDARNYLARENSTINEDDFFEFFLKEALKMKQDDVDKLRTEGVEPNNKNPETNYEEDKQDDNEDTQALEQLEAILHRDDSTEGPQALLNLFKSLELDGMQNGPFESLLQNLSNEPDLK
ncbi:uncharacterized protein KNAG_0J01660 [Huiozyma naganishii CBS 8797]|uniref:Uncharacterized protein n=1 Tax=Huiozyma naganishii (strain ATCC MYA-139 / BCRC 22969 / CBS 8797 / KCTC 17520 / NBRC 10181 / NCYC 3082 / Yp74L-3) TaxID=1071383 RepID=J7S2U6_HUIN7|nr:hypothetical protein KNAG_0J01660 [Kazachstania naganishii CBS 8797]CCK72247.1 hypothetical protein KNAG_0J01660 [Kazachstania naganishii CBS 8797]